MKINMKCLCNKLFIDKKKFIFHTAKCPTISKIVDKFPGKSKGKIRKLLRSQILQEDLYSPTSKLNYDYIVCPYCTKLGLPDRYTMLGGPHFACHGKTKEETLKEFPEIKLKRNKAQELSEKTCEDKYGVKNVFQTEKIKEIIDSRDKNWYEQRNKKAEETNLEKYGVRNQFQREDIIESVKNRDEQFYKERNEKTIETNLNRYGAEHHMKTKEGKQKVKKAFLKSFGAENPMFVPEIKQKVTQANKDNHGGLFNSQTENWLVSLRKKWKNKSKEEIEKITKERKITSIKNWGVSNPAQHPEIKKKIKESLKSLSGSEIAFAHTGAISGYRPDLDGVYRSIWEANFARYLLYKGVYFKYEQETFELKISENIKVTDRSNKPIVHHPGSLLNYTPDFYTDHYIEIKGIMDQLSELKIQLFKKQYPKEAESFQIIDGAFYKKLAKNYAEKIPFWEDPTFNIRTHPESFGLTEPNQDIDRTVYNAKNYKKATKEKKIELVDDILQYYRLHGFPYHKYNKKLFLEEIKRFRKSNIEIKENILNPPSLGQNILWYFMPHLWEVSNEKQSARNFWEDDEKLRKLIKTRFKHCTIISNENIRRGLRLQCKSATNFNPSLMKYLIETYGKKDSTIYDFCAGFGGRFLGAAVAKNVKKYIATDPALKTYIGLQNLNQWLIDQKIIDSNFAEFHQKKAEEFVPSEQADLIITSPPYYDKEIYSADNSQSAKIYKNYDNWFINFLLKSITTAVSILSQNGYLILSVTDTKRYPIYSDLKKKLPYKLINDLKVQYPQTYNKSKFTENILIYQK